MEKYCILFLEGREVSLALEDIGEWSTRSLNTLAKFFMTLSNQRVSYILNEN